MEPTCCRCAARTWIIWDARPWCREHFLAAREEAGPATS